MSFYVFTTSDGIHFRHAKDPCSVTVVDDAMKPVGKTFPANTDFDCAAAIKAYRLAMGYWQADLEVYDLQSGELQTTFPFKRVAPLATFDQTGNRLLFKSGKQVVLLDVTTSEALQVKGVQALDRLVKLKKTNEVLVASQRKSELLRISLETAEVDSITLPIDATFFDVKPSPRASRLILIDRKKGVHCVDTSDWSMVWSVSLKKTLGRHHMGVGQYCGDGTLFGGAVSGGSHNYMIVLDAETGEHVGRLDTNRYGLPYRDTWIRDKSSRRDSYLVDTLDLATGEESTMSLKGKDG